MIFVKINLNFWFKSMNTSIENESFTDEIESHCFT